MTYDQFIDYLAKSQTKHIKPLYLPGSCAPDMIPSSFGSCLVDVLSILENYFDELSQGKPLLGIFGLQVASAAIESSSPTLSNRTLQHGSDRSHFCCSLSYLPLHEKELNVLDDWSNAESVIIDFTRGLVMNDVQYLFETFRIGAPGKVYGVLPEEKLTLSWEHNRQLAMH